MTLKRIVKVGNITNLSDARYCSGMGVDMLGFQVIEGAANHLPASTYQEIKGWIAGPKVVAELYGMNDSHSLEKILQDYHPDLVELSALELPYLPNDFSIPMIFAGVLNNNASHSNIAFILSDSATEQSSVPLLTPCENKEALKTILENPAIKGIVLKGSPEEKPGQQDYHHLADILEALDEDY